MHFSRICSRFYTQIHTRFTLMHSRTKWNNANYVDERYYFFSLLLRLGRSSDIFLFKRSRPTQKMNCMNALWTRNEREKWTEKKIYNEIDRISLAVATHPTHIVLVCVCVHVWSGPPKSIRRTGIHTETEEAKQRKIWRKKNDKKTGKLNRLEIYGKYRLASPYYVAIATI